MYLTSGFLEAPIAALHREDLLPGLHWVEPREPGEAANLFKRKKCKKSDVIYSKTRLSFFCAAALIENVILKKHILKIIPCNKMHFA